MEEKFKEFKPTSWAIDNKTSIYILAIIISVFGMISYNSIPKEQFPEIVIPTIIVNTIYPGTSPSDIENLITRPLEKNLKAINGVKKVTSRSIQDFSSVVVEFGTGMEIADSKQKVKDAVDKTKSSLPNNLPQDPMVMEIDLSEIPIMYMNITGDMTLDKLKKHAEKIQDKIEGLKEITRVDIVGALDREIQINVDMYKMQAASVSFTDIERAISAENVTVSGGNIEMQGMNRSIRVVGEFQTMEEIKNIQFKSSSGAIVTLKEVAEIKDSFKEQESFSRFNGKNVITLNVIKKSGQNLLDASDKIHTIVEKLQKDELPTSVSIQFTGEQSKFTRRTLEELNNTIIIGFILVVIVLMFFMGVTNAVFVGLSVPLSMAIAYIVLPGIDFTMNMMVMFSFIFALGIVVDDAIVVVENTHRIFKQQKGKMDIVQASKAAAGEVFVPILSGTLTTVAPFVPLAFWPGTVGKFMHFLPITIIITLFASLFVAYIINPVFAVTFMEHEEDKKTPNRKVFIISGILAALGVLAHVISYHGTGNLIIFIALSYVGHHFWGNKVLLHFQHTVIPAILNQYEKLLRFVMHGKRPYLVLYATILLLMLSFGLFIAFSPKVLFFPENEPNNVSVFIAMPVGTDVKTTDSIASIVEKKVIEAIGKDNPIVESVITNVALGASENAFDNSSKTSNRAKITVNFVEFVYRNGENTLDYLEKIRGVIGGIAGAEVTVGKNSMGPPTGKPVNIEITGDNLDQMLATSRELKKYLNSLKITGIEELKTDFDASKPEITIEIDRKRANMEGITTGQVGMEIRTAVLGKEISKFREGEDQYPIQLRYTELQRENIDRLMNLKITYRDMTTGLLRQIPLSAVANVKYVNTYGGINRKNLKRVITLQSNVLAGSSAPAINNEIALAMPNFNKPEGIEISMTGETEDIAETQAFLGSAMLLALFAILFILITQFNSIGRPVIIISEVLFSLIGVILGLVIFRMPMVIAFTGMGLVALAGIVVRNGILLVEFTDVLIERGYRTREAIILAGKTRITPVLLTATATILGLIPLAVGFNINFESLFTHFDPQIFIGGDNVMFFGPLAWSIIFGLTFATFLTLVIIPAMYYIMYAAKIKSKRFSHKTKMNLNRH